MHDPLLCVCVAFLIPDSADGSSSCATMPVPGRGITIVFTARRHSVTTRSVCPPVGLIATVRVRVRVRVRVKV